MAPISRKLAPDRWGWAPSWSEAHSLSYGLNEAQVQAQLDKSEP